MNLLAILTIARYESKMLLRTWRFRVLALLGVGMTALMIISSSILSLLPARFNYEPVVSSMMGMMSGTIATYSAVTNFSFLFSVIVAFCAVDVLEKDRKSRMEELLHSSPIGATELVAGKFLGVVFPILALGLIVLLFNILMRILIEDFPIRFAQYTTYFFLFIVPGVCISVALVMFLAIALRQRIFAAIVAIAWIVPASIFLRFKLGGIFDWNGTSFNAVYSDLSGFIDLGPLLLNRVFYVCVTLFLLGLSSALFPFSNYRPRDRKLASAVAAVMFVGCLVLGGALIHRVSALETRDQSMIELESRYTDRTQARVSHYDLSVSLNRGRLEAAGTMSVQNGSDSPMQEGVFVLNPGLKITKLEPLERDYEVEWDRDGSVLLARFSPALPPKEEIILAIQYAGPMTDELPILIEENRSPSSIEETQAYDIERFQGYRVSLLRGDYWFLLSSSRWYPMPNVEVGYSYPRHRPANFATATLEIDLPARFTVATQGERASDELQGKRRKTVWKIEKPVPEMAVIAGDYRVKTAEIGDVEVEFYYAPVHERFVSFLQHGNEELRRIYREKLEGFEQNAGLDYPYRRFSIIEVPIQMKSLEAGWRQQTLLGPPGMLLSRELDLVGARLDKAVEYRLEDAEEDQETAEPEVLLADVLDRFFACNPSGPDAPAYFVRNFWTPRIAGAGDLHALFDVVMPGFIQGVGCGRYGITLRDYFTNLQRLGNLGMSFGGGGGNVTISMNLNLAREVGLHSLTSEEWTRLAETPLRDISPSDGKDYFRKGLLIKGKSFLNILRESMGHDSFSEFLGEFLRGHEYAEVTVEEFLEAAGEIKGEDFSWMADQFLFRSEVPIYRLTRAEATPLEHGQTRKEYQFRIGIKNITDARGVAGIEIALENDKIEKKILMGPREEKEWFGIATKKPLRVTVNSFFSGMRNRVQKKFLHRSIPIESEGQEEVVVVDSGEESGRVEIVVDDLDPGFSTAQVKSGGRRATKEVRSWEEAYPQWRGFGQPREWRSRYDAEAYGTFYLTSKVKRAGTGNELACWEAQIPKTGEYEVSVHLADSRLLTQMVRTGTYQYSIRQGESELQVEVEMESAKEGWNILGKMRLVAGEPAIVELSDKGNKRGMIMADAVKWVQVVEEESE